MSVMGAITAPHLKSLSLAFRIIDAMYPPYPCQSKSDNLFLFMYLFLFVALKHNENKMYCANLVMSVHTKPLHLQLLLIGWMKYKLK